MVKAVTSAQVRVPARAGTWAAGPAEGAPAGHRPGDRGPAGQRPADRGLGDGVPGDRGPADRGPANGMPSPGSLPRCRVAPSALALLESARRGLAEAIGETEPASRYVAAHLAALRAAAAVVAARGEPVGGSRRRRPRSVWELLPQVEPTLAEWAAFFAAGASKRAAAEAGLSRAVTAREADDLLRDAEIFLSVVETALGVPSQSPLPLRTAG
jgi:hypothetical protein